MSKKFIFVDANGDYEETPGAYEISDHISVSSGAGDAFKPVVLNGDGKIDPTMIAFDSLTWKQPARVATTAAIDLTAPGATIDGVTMVNGDRVLVKNGSTVNSGTNSIDNGIYVFNGAASPMTRATDLNEDSELVAGVVVAIEEGTDHADQVYIVTSDNPLSVGTSPVQFDLLPVNTFSAGDGIDITNNVISVDLLDVGSGLHFAGGATDELAIEFATTFTIDGADALAFKASDLASTTNGEGASIVGIENASAYYAGNDLETVLNELEAQIGGLTSSTFNFTEDNVLADNDAVYAALDKLDLKWGDLASTATNEGASLVGIEDVGNNYASSDVEGALAEIAEKLIDRDCATAGELISAGDLLYFSANDTVSIYSNISVSQRAVGVALEGGAAASEVCYARWDEVAFGAITGLGATAGDRIYWDGTNLTTTIPGTSGQYVWQAGIAKNADDMLATVEFIKKNS
jgi:hypothetical protein